MDMHPLLYASDLTDAEWALIEPLLPAEASTGRPRIHARRTILNAIFYALRTGCAWRFRLDGTWERIHQSLRQRLRVQPACAACVCSSLAAARSRSPAQRWLSGQSIGQNH